MPLRSRHLDWALCIAMAQLTFLHPERIHIPSPKCRRRGCGVPMHNSLPPLCPSQGLILLVKSQILKSSIALNGGSANLWRHLAPTDLMGHIGNSVISLPKTCLNTELCDCLFGIQGHHTSGFSHIITKTFRNSYDQSVPKNKLTAVLNTGN